MTEHFAAAYFDGQTGRRYAVELRRVGASHYAIEGDGVRRGGSIAALSVTPPIARIARTIDFGDGARLLLAHDAQIDAWFSRQSRLETLVDRLERHAYATAVAIAICIGALIGGAMWGVPWLADRIADRVPPSVEHSLGAQVLASLDRFGLKPTALGAARRNALSRRFEQLSGDLGPDLRVEFRDAPRVGANAFAVPGGTVVVTDQLVKLLHDDREFDAVVAHELGHQQHRHVLRQTLRGSFIAIAAAFFAGDVSSAGAVVIAIPTFLLSSHYSRDFEAEADRYAFDLLARHDESPHWFAAAMRTLQAQTPDNGHLAYLSSHPSTADRIASADTAAQRFASAHPQLCPDGVCPGEGAGAGSAAVCTACEADAAAGDGDDDADDDSEKSPDFVCEKKPPLDAVVCHPRGPSEAH